LVLTVDQLALLVRLWQREVDEDGANMDADSRHDGRYLEITTTFGGDVLLRGRFDAEAGTIVKTCCSGSPTSSTAAAVAGSTGAGAATLGSSTPRAGAAVVAPRVSRRASPV
jgi:hypothetical protein